MKPKPGPVPLCTPHPPLQGLIRIQNASFSDEIIILSATGTAAKVNLNLDQYQTVRPSPQQLLLAPADKGLQMEKDKEKDKKLFVDVNLANQVASRVSCTSRGER